MTQEQESKNIKPLQFAKYLQFYGSSQIARYKRSSKRRGTISNITLTNDTIWEIITMTPHNHKFKQSQPLICRSGHHDQGGKEIVGNVNRDFCFLHDLNALETSSQRRRGDT